MKFTLITKRLIACLTLLWMCLAPAQAQPFDAYDIYVVHAPTGTTFQITDLPGTGAFNPAWSPLGFRLVHDVVAFDADGEIVAHDLYVTNVFTGASTPLAGGGGGNDATWSPGGVLIAFDRALSPAPDPTLYVVPAFGGPRFTIRRDAVDPSWSPTGRFLAFAQPSDGSVRTIDLLTGNTSLVADGTNPVWSPDGRHIAFSLAGDLYRVPVDAAGRPVGPVEQLTTDPAIDSQPSWTPDGRRIVFHSDRSGDFDLYVIPADGSGPATPLTGLPGVGDFDPAVFPFGRFVAYAGFTDPSASKAAQALPEVTEALTGAFKPAREAGGAEQEVLAHLLRLDGAPAALGAHTPHPEPKRRYQADPFSTASYPNPFNPSTTISFTLPEASPVTLQVFDLLGREVATLAQGTLEAGLHTVRFDASHLPSGTYLYRLEAGILHTTKQLILLK